MLALGGDNFSFWSRISIRLDRAVFLGSSVFYIVVVIVVDEEEKFISDVE